MTSHAELLPRYTREREVRFHLNHMLVQSLDKDALDEAGRALGILRRGVFVLDTEDQSSVLMDYAIHDVRSGGRNAVERYLQKEQPRLSDQQIAALQSMLRAHYSVFETADTEPGVGLQVRDVLRGGTAFLVDVGLGSTARKGRSLATRVIPHDDFITTTGAALPVSPTTMSRIEQQLKRRFPAQTDFTALAPGQQAEVAALVIRTCLAADASSHVVYAEPSQISTLTSTDAPRSSFRQVSAESALVRPRANRNDPCPCGSGKKYKSCCGKR